jgi:Asp/Glu/hydantoin racemase
MLEEARPAVESQEDSDAVAPLVVERIRRLARDGGAAGFVIACFSDPGLHAAREATRLPVFGIGESGLLGAMMIGQRIGVLSILPASIPRHWRMYGAMGIAGRIGGDISVGIGVVELESRPDALDRLVEKGIWLRDQAQCEVLVPGCAGMAPFEAELTRRIGIPVLDPVRAAAGHALARALLARTAAAAR